MPSTIRETTKMLRSFEQHRRVEHRSPSAPSLVGAVDPFCKARAISFGTRIPPRLFGPISSNDGASLWLINEPRYASPQCGIAKPRILGEPWEVGIREGKRWVAHNGNRPRSPAVDDGGMVDATGHAKNAARPRSSNRILPCSTPVWRAATAARPPIRAFNHASHV